jgi:electron transfer flavoprotein alpha subunit
MTGILLVAETVENRLEPSQHELSAVNRILRSELSGPSRMVVCGGNIRPVAEMLARRHGIDTIGVEHEKLTYPNPVLWADVLHTLVKETRPAYVGFMHTLRAGQTAAALAVRHQAACLTAVESISFEHGRPLFHRAIFNGKLTTAIRSHSELTLFTAAPGAFSRQAQPADPAAGAQVSIRAFEAESAGFETTGLKRAAESHHAVETADVIVAAGQGIGKAENLKLLEDVAGVFKNATVGGSRVVCDRGWLPHDCQIGETGKRVSPKMYIACGISGARQHLAGMQRAQTIVAINTDPHAPIFAQCDVAIVEDLNTFLPLLLEKHREFCDKLREPRESLELNQLRIEN